MSEIPHLSAILTPHRSLTQRGFVILLAVIVAICVSNAVFYWYLGAWPVAFFVLADIVIVWLAFHVNFRAGRISEQVTVSRTGVQVRKIDARGRAREHTFNPLWARFHVDRHEELGITRMQIRGEGYVSTIGSFLNPEDRESFASAFASALARAR